jgi:predicted N-acetyltransferase YhbS
MRIRVMTENDVPAGLRLNTLSGWNQTSADWHSFLRQSPKGCFVVEQDSKVVGTVTTMTYENRFAWIGMVLVDPEYRKQGIGTQLLGKAIEYLDQSHVPAIKLDATPVGKPLYTKLGFVTEYEIERWILKRPPTQAHTTVGTSNDFLTPSQLEQIFELDREVFGADRGLLLLRSLKTQGPEFALAVRQEKLLEGYCFGRHGLFADHLGPWVARNHAAAKKLLHEFLTRSSRDTVIVDRVTSNSSVVGLLRTYGFAPSRPLTRMVRGPNLYPGRPDLSCAILGPEFG